MKKNSQVDEEINNENKFEIKNLSETKFKDISEEIEQKEIKGIYTKYEEKEMEFSNIEEYFINTSEMKIKDNKSENYFI